MKKIIIIGVIVLGSAAWYLGSPLFISNEVNEPFPVGTFNEVDLNQMSDEERRSIEEEIMRAVANSPDVVMSENMPEKVGLRIASGNFQDFDSFHQGSGKATIYNLSNNQRILRLEDFRVTNGPDLHVLLVKHPNPQNRDDLSTDYLDLGQLKGNVGNQNYELPPDTTIEDYRSIVIYCQPFHVIFSVAKLTSIR